MKDDQVKTQLEALEKRLFSLRSISQDLWTPPKPPQPDAKEGENVAQAQTGVEGGDAQKDGASEQDEPKKDVDELLRELNMNIGLDKIKREVNSLINMVKVRKMRTENDLPTASMSLHMVFTGNPGTGKTMVARLLAQIYNALGVLSKGQLIEVDRAGLVAGYVGQTALKVTDVVKSAIGGILFIDEAYTLATNSQNDFGQEAIDILLKLMEDNRHDLVVIVAGYPAPMQTFVNSNPGLASRFNRYLHFDDYSADELMQIFDVMCQKNIYEISEDAKEPLKKLIEELSSDDPEDFGNARGVRNLLEDIIVCQSNRLAVKEDITKDDLLYLTKQDVEKAREGFFNPEPGQNRDDLPDGEARPL